jgi:hypothetical protein
LPPKDHPDDQDLARSRRPRGRPRRLALRHAGPGPARVRRRAGLRRQSLHLRGALPHLPARARHGRGRRRDRRARSGRLLTITKAISIQGHGFSGISVAGSGVGITVNASATDAVSLNGLLIDGSGVGSRGILFNSGKSLVVASCVVRNVINDAMRFGPSAATQSWLSVSNSFFTDSGNGIVIATGGSGAATASIDRSGFYGNAFGIEVAGNRGTGALDVTVADSVAANNENSGFMVHSLAGHSVSTLSLMRVVSSGNDTGVFSFGPTATMLLAQSTVTANGTGFNAFIGGVIRSYGDNAVDDNIGNMGALSAATRQ